LISALAGARASDVFGASLEMLRAVVYTLLGITKLPLRQRRG